MRRLIFLGLGHILACDPAVVRQHEHLFRAVACVLVQVGSRREIRIFGEAELVELRPSAAQPDLLRRRGIDKIERDKPTQAGPVPRLDHQMANRPRDRVNDHANYLAADPIDTPGVSPDHEWCLCHGRPPHPHGA